MPPYISVPAPLARKICDSARAHVERKRHGSQSTSAIQSRGFAFNATQHDAMEMNYVQYYLIEWNSNTITPT